MGNRIRGVLTTPVRVAKRALTKDRLPRRYRVWLVNDDYTPMGFVIEVLERFFAMSPDRAMQVMLLVHHQGKAVCGVYTRDIAETKVAQVNDCAKQHEHPLLCIMEPRE